MSVKTVLNTLAVFELCRRHSPAIHHAHFDERIAICKSRLDDAKRADEISAQQAAFDSMAPLTLVDAARVEGETPVLIAEIEQGLGVADNG